MSHSPYSPLTLSPQAPEVLLSRKATSASDVWSYGCLIHEAFTAGSGEEKYFHLLILGLVELV